MPVRVILIGSVVAVGLLAGLAVALSSSGRRDAAPRRAANGRMPSGWRPTTAHSSRPRLRPAGRRAIGGAPTVAAPPRRHRRPPGSLPQTTAFPSARTVAFRREMSALWRAIATDRPRVARSAFFPEGAYLRLKAIEGAASDYSGRLLRDYALDVGAAHALLGRGGPTARLLGVQVHASYGHWVPPGVCYNRVGYYEVPNSRVLYREHGQLRSFGIASMISWHGVWYVVHLGAILRSGAGGVVDQPAIGPGVSEPSSTC